MKNKNMTTIYKFERANSLLSSKIYIIPAIKSI